MLGLGLGLQLETKEDNDMNTTNLPVAQLWMEGHTAQSSSVVCASRWIAAPC